MKVAIYPGSFDPITLGHIDIINRASLIFDEIIVAILVNSSKTPCFTLDEKIELIRLAIGDNKKIKIKSFDGLLADFAKNENVNIIIKGLRAVSDFEYEFQMALANKKINPLIETLFLNSSDKYLYLSSSLVKDIAKYNGDITSFVHKKTKDKIQGKLGRKDFE